MKNPFRILDLPEKCNDQEVKKAYLQMVKRYPPEQYPERFRDIRSAFDSIKTEKDRMALQLFRVPEIDVDHIFELLLNSSRPGTINKVDFLNVLADDLTKFRLIAKS